MIGEIEDIGVDEIQSALEKMIEDGLVEKILLDTNEEGYRITELGKTILSQELALIERDELNSPLN